MYAYRNIIQIENKICIHRVFEKSVMRFYTIENSMQFCWNILFFLFYILLNLCDGYENGFFFVILMLVSVIFFSNILQIHEGE